MNPYKPPYLPLEENLIDRIALINITVEASKNLAVYKTVLDRTKLGKIFMLSSLTKREALYSTKIEGTQATLDELYESDIDKNKKNEDINEINNYIACFEFAANYVKDYPISTRMFKQMHEFLLAGNVRGKNRNPGCFRSIQNFIGPDGCTQETASFVPPAPNMVDEYMGNLDNYINSQDENSLIKTAIIHAQFETIHPFLDGNGRVGRVLIPLTLYKYNEINNPYFYVSQALEKDKYKYYTLLNNTRRNTTQDWTIWIKFFLNAINSQAKKETLVINKIDNIFDKTLVSAQNILKTNRIIDIVNYLFKNPIFTANSMCEDLGINQSTTRGYIDKLLKQNIVFSNNSYRNRKYYFYDLLEILREM